MNVLFVCTGNYYRSRFAEIYFNFRASALNVTASATSKGFRLNPDKNKGPLSPHTVTFLSDLNIPLANGSPSVLNEEDLARATRVIVLDEKEHRPMMRQRFPNWEQRVEYWRFEDDYITDPGEVLPLLRDTIDGLLEELRTRPHPN